MSSSLFAYSVDNHILGGHLWVIIMFLLSFVSWTLSAAVPEGSDVMGEVDKVKIFETI